MKEYYRRHLPHWQPQGATFFVTFRLKGSIPYTVIESLQLEQEMALQKMPERKRVKQELRRP